MDAPLVSIIIPLYNSANYLAETIRSAMAQTWVNKEIIIVDDGSTDDSLAIARTFESDKIKVFSQPNAGASAARNRGLAEAKGEYIQFLDADDLLSVDKIERQVALLQASPGFISACYNINFFDDADHTTQKSKASWIKAGSTDPYDFLMKLYGGDVIGPEYGGMVTIHAWLSPKNILEKAGGWNESLSVDDDGEYFCRVILLSKGILFTEGVFSYYRQHSNHKNLSAGRTERAYQSAIKAIDLKYRHLADIASDKQLLHLVFGRLYSEVGVSAYPKFKEYSADAFIKARQMGNYRPVYKSGLIGNMLIRLLGWRIVKTINYYRYGF